MLHTGVAPPGSLCKAHGTNRHAALGPSLAMVCLPVPPRSAALVQMSCALHALVAMGSCAPARCVRVPRPPQSRYTDSAGSQPLPASAAGLSPRLHTGSALPRLSNSPGSLARTASHGIAWGMDLSEEDPVRHVLDLCPGGGAVLQDKDTKPQEGQGTMTTLCLPQIGLCTPLSLPEESPPVRQD